MPRLSKRPTIVKHIMIGEYDNQIAQKLSVSREYVRLTRLKFENETIKELLTLIKRQGIRFSPPNYIEFKFLIDAYLVKVTYVDLVKNKTLAITPTGKKFLDYLMSRYPTQWDEAKHQLSTSDSGSLTGAD